MARGRKTGGRTKGTPNKTTGEVAARCRALIESPSYVADFERRLRAGELPPALEALTWHYAYGKPTEHHEHSGPGGGPIAYAWAD